jgi:hypothetical protein
MRPVHPKVPSEAEATIGPGILRSISRPSPGKGRGRACDLVLSRESIRISTAAAWALFASSDKVEKDTAARLTVEQVTRRNEAVSVAAAMAIGACALPDQVVKTAQVLSVLSRRRALIVPLLVGACKQDWTLVTTVAKLLPPDREVAIIDAFSNGTKLVRTAFDDLADVRIIEEILRRLHFLFVPKPKQT